MRYRPNSEAGRIWFSPTRSLSTPRSRERPRFAAPPRHMSASGLYHLDRFDRLASLASFPASLESEMVGIFSRISGGWRSQRRGKSEIEAGNTLSSNEEGSSGTDAIRHGFEASVQFKPVERPSEPLVHDQAITCPKSEPNILNDGRIWKERRTSATASATTNLPVVKDGSHCQSRDEREKPPPDPAEHPVSTSVSAPDHNSSVTLGEKCSTSDDQTS